MLEPEEGHILSLVLKANELHVCSIILHHTYIYIAIANALIAASMLSVILQFLFCSTDSFNSSDEENDDGELN